MRGRKPKYEREDVEKFVSLVEGGMKRTEAAKSLGINIKSVHHTAKRLGIELPKRTAAIDLIKPYEQQILAGKISQWDIAKETGLSQCCVSKIYKEQGWPCLPVGGQGRNATLPRAVRESQAEELIAYLIENGGYVVPSIKKLGLEIGKCYFYSYCKKHGFNYRPYRWAGREYGYWVTLPCEPPKVGLADYIIDARCTLCGTVHKVHLINMKVGASTMCRQCAAERRTHASVQCVETKQRFRSILNAAQAIGSPYQGFRKEIVKRGEVEFQGKTYRLIKKVYTNELAQTSNTHLASNASQ